MRQRMICTACPNGCRMEASYLSREDLTLTGYGCDRGKAFAEEECFAPTRILTATVAVVHSERKALPVRTTIPIPKELLLACLREIRNVSLEAPVASHQVIISDILGTGANVVASMGIERKE